MKKILYVLFIFVVSIMCINVDAKTIYLKECEYTDEYKRWLALSDKEKDKITMPTVCKNNSKDKFAFVGNSISNFVGASISDTKYDLREHGLVTPVKNQGETESCWAFATNTSIESNLLVNGKGTYDLSEAHIELATQNTHNYNRLTFNRVINGGGNYFISSSYLRNNWGSVLESTLPFSELVQSYQQETIISESKVLDNKAMLDVNSISMFGNSGSCTTNTIKDIKEYLITNGALATTVNFNNFGAANLYQYYDGEEYVDKNDVTVPANQHANHAVTIVGWDDSISKNNFNTSNKPTRDGAFIVQNSYGEGITESIIQLKNDLYESATDFFNGEGIYSASAISNDFIIQFLKIVYDATDDQIKISGDNIIITIGENGYQYVSYDDVLVCNNVFGFFDVDTEVEDNVYGYDELGLNNEAFLTNLKKLYFASVFEKKSDKEESLEELNIYFPVAGQDYKIYFANGKTQQILQSNLIAQGTSTFSGFHTINIDNAFITSDKFSIIVEVEDDIDLVFGVSTSLPGEGDPWDDIEMIEGVQYLSNDGITYSDVAAEGGFHLLIKAYTNELEESIDNGSGTLPPETNGDENDTNPDDDENKGDIIIPGGEVKPEDDNTNTDGKIEILPNDMNNKLPENNNSDNVENPKTGDMESVILIVSFITIIFAFVSYRRLQVAKQK